MIIMINHLLKEWLHQIGITSFLPNHALIRNKNPPVRPRKHSQHCDLLANSDLVINHPLHNRGKREGEMRRRRRGNRTEERLITRGQGKTRCDDVCFEFARGGHVAGCTQPNQLNHMFVLEIILATSRIEFL